MASTFAGSARQKAASGRIDIPLAAVAALAVAFAAFVMPGDLLSRAVEGSGLPQVLSAAQPPLGSKARALLAGAAAISTFLVLFGLLRMLDRKSAPAARGRQDEPDPPIEPAAPRLRRADVHPDAPARRPILAARELGEPAPRATEPAPFWRPDDFPAEPEEEAVQPPQSADQPAVAEEPEPLDLADPEIELLQPEAFAVAPDPEPAIEELAPPPNVDDSSLPDLMLRLERGLARRLRQKGVFPAPQVRQAAEAATGPEAEPAPLPVPAPRFQAEGDDRLRNAIENLQKIAARAR